MIRVFGTTDKTFTSNVLYIPAGGACEMRYDKTTNKFFEIYNG